MTTLKQRAADTAERIMQRIEDRRCVLKEDLVREVLATLAEAEAAHWSPTERSPANSDKLPPSHFFRLAIRLHEQGHPERGNNMMKNGFGVMLSEGRLTREEFRALIQHYLWYI